MGIFSQIIGGNLGDLFEKIVGTFKLPPEKEAELKMLAMQNAQELAKIQADMESKAIDVAGQNIRAETGSDDKYTSRARPSFIYLMLGIYVFNYVVFPLINKPPVSFPEALFWLFGSCMLGYTGARTWEKYADSKFSANK